MDVYTEVPPIVMPAPTVLPVTAPVDVPQSEGIKWREGLWTVVYHDDGTMGISDWPIPADRPEGHA